MTSPLGTYMFVMLYQTLALSGEKERDQEREQRIEITRDREVSDPQWVTLTRVAAKLVELIGRK